MKRNAYILTKYTLIIMRYSSLFVLAITLGSTMIQAHPVEAQGLHTTLITLQVRNKTLQQVFKEIERQSDYRFVYNNGAIPENQKVTIQQEATIDEVLQDLAQRTHTRYKQVGKNIVVTYQPPQQPGRISGNVSDAEGQPLGGANINIVGHGRSYQTDGDGHYTFNIAPGTYTLAISYISYLTKHEQIEVQEGQSVQLNVVLQPSLDNLDEVIVVGYGTQRKESLTGAVSQLSSADLEGRVTPNVVRSIQGMIPGVNVSFADGKPSRGAVPVIRGVTNSIGAGGSALVLIDGAEGNMTDVNPADIETISVLKDASSASVYGARGAFGVILITTKKADQGSTKITYDGNYSVNSRTVVPELVTDGYLWTTKFLEAYIGSRGVDPNAINNVFRFDRAWYEELGRRSQDPNAETVGIGTDGLYDYYGSTDWHSIIFKDSHTSQQHNLSVYGGNDRANFYVSGRFYDQDGIYNAGNENFKQYNIRAKGEIKVKPWLTIGNNLDVTKIKYHQPMVMYDRQLIQRQMEHQAYPVTVEKNPDGTWTETAVYIGWAGFVEGTSYQYNDRLNLRNRTNFELRAIPDVFTIRGDLTYAAGASFRDRLENQYNFFTGPQAMGTRNTFSSLENWRYDENYVAGNLTLDYTPNLGSAHDLKLMLGSNIEERLYKTQQTYRRGLLYPDLPSFSMMDGTFYTTASGGNEWGFLGAFFRANYGYQNKYLLELSGRYDGTSKFPKDQQWGFFPSASAGWVLSNEEFLANASWLTNLKVRASLGTLGNGLVAPYSYLSTMGISRSSVLIGGTQQSYTSAPNLVPTGLTWEKVTTYDVGLDFSALNNRLDLVVDYYEKYTTDMYTVGPTLPAVLGVTAPRGNNADMKTRGWEVSIGWRDSFGLAGKPFNWSVRGMLWDNRSWITKFYNATGLITTYYEGMELGDIWGFRVEGLFFNQQEIDNHADQSFFYNTDSRITAPGDLKFADLNNDGVINRGNQTLDNHGDMEVIGNTTPRYQFGLNLDANWNNIGFSIFLQGVGKRDWYPARESAYFWGQYNRPYSYLLQAHMGNNVWSEENPNPNAYWPRYRAYIAQNSVGTMALPNDRYLQDVSYLRIKNITLSYTLPNRIAGKLGLAGLKLYATGENLFTFSNLFNVTKNFDPEVIEPGDADFRSTAGADGDGYSYPMLKTVTVGLNITL